MNHRVVIVVNPTARRLPRRDRLHAACAEAAKAGWSVDVAVTQTPRDATSMARQAAGSCAAVFACGGDGTVNEVANGLLGTSVALGCIPGGTSNLWAADHEIGDGPEAALRLLIHGATRLSDVGWVEHPGGERAFLLMAGFGFDAVVTEGVGRREKQLAGPLAYVRPAIVAALTYRSPHATLRHDDGEEEIDLGLVVASNTRLYARFPLAPQALADDGMFDVTVVDTPAALPSGIPALSQLLLGQTDSTSLVRRLRSSHLAVEATGVPLQVDGDVVGSAPARISMRPAALRVIVPTTANPMYREPPGPSLQRLLEGRQESDIPAD